MSDTPSFQITVVAYLFTNPSSFMQYSSYGSLPHNGNGAHVISPLFSRSVKKGDSIDLIPSIDSLNLGRFADNNFQSHATDDEKNKYVRKQIMNGTYVLALAHSVDEGASQHSRKWKWVQVPVDGSAAGGIGSANQSSSNSSFATVSENSSDPKFANVSIEEETKRIPRVGKRAKIVFKLRRIPFGSKFDYTIEFFRKENGTKVALKTEQLKQMKIELSHLLGWPKNVNIGRVVNLPNIKSQQIEGLRLRWTKNILRVTYRVPDIDDLNAELIVYPETDTGRGEFGKVVSLSRDANQSSSSSSKSEKVVKKSRNYEEIRLDNDGALKITV